MKNLFQFILRYSYTMLFLLLEGLAFLLLFQNNRHQGANFLGFIHEISGNLYAFSNNTTQYFNLTEVNEKLAKENEALRKNQREYYYSLSPQTVYFGDTASTLQYTFVSAEVLQNSLYNRDNFITLNIGKQQGIEPEMGVISEAGIVGIVHRVSPHYSRVISILNSKVKVGVQLKSTEYFGLMTWPGYDPALGRVQDIPAHVNVQQGDTIVTRGNSVIYPEGINVGIVQEVATNDETGFHDITIEFAHDFKRDGYVYVVRDKFKKERKALETEEENE